MEHGEISTNYKVSETLSNPTTLSLMVSTAVYNPTTISIRVADPILKTTDNSTIATKSINSVDSFCKKATHEIDCVTGFTAVRGETMNCLPPQFLPPSFAIQLQHMMQSSQKKDDMYGGCGLMKVCSVLPRQSNS